jgi:copper homeostasis protein
MTLEIIASSLTDALEAEQGGATRLELCIALDQEGLTMPLDLVATIKSRVSIPVRVMLRETPTYSATPAELERLQVAARECEAMQVDGLVIGFADLTSNSAASPSNSAANSSGSAGVDWPLTESLLKASNLPATMQRAFEFEPDPIHAIGKLKSFRQFDTLLSNAWGEDWNQRAHHLESMRQSAAPSITILAGGGVNADVIRLLRQQTGIAAFHCGKPARDNGQVTAAKVKLLRQAMNS